jgi:DNA adenine methylase
MLGTDNFEHIHRLLSKVVLLCSDFEYVIALAQEGDLVFVDPPYTAKHNNNGFVKYNDRLFSWQDQVRLRDCLLQARRRGVFVVGTNANAPVPILVEKGMAYSPESH